MTSHINPQEWGTICSTFGNNQPASVPISSMAVGSRITLPPMDTSPTEIRCLRKASFLLPWGVRTSYNLRLGPRSSSETILKRLAYWFTYNITTACREAGLSVHGCLPNVKRHAILGIEDAQCSICRLPHALGVLVRARTLSFVRSV